MVGVEVLQEPDGRRQDEEVAERDADDEEDRDHAMSGSATRRSFGLNAGRTNA